MAKPLEQAISDKAFFYVSPHNDLVYLDSGDILTPAIGGGMVCKAFWVKNSPQHVTLLAEVVSSRDTFINFMKSKIKQGVNKSSVVNLAVSFGAINSENELSDKEKI